MSEARTSEAYADARTLSLALGLLLFAPIVLLGNEIGSLLRYPEVGAAVLFPPYAVLTAALLVSARRHWVWYILVAGIAHFVTHWPQWSLSWVLLANVANVARALTAAILLQWVFKGPPTLESIPSLLLFVASAVVAAPAVGATIGAANVVLHGASPTYWRPWTAWFLSNALTGLTILPAFVAALTGATRWHRGRIDRRRILEALMLAVALGVTCAPAFLLRDAGDWPRALPFYAPLPVLIWIALRFGPGGASIALTVVTFAAIWAADRRTGPFFGSSPDENVLALQLFVLLTTLTVLCIAAVSSARRGLLQLYRALLASLQDHVAILDARGIVLEVNDSWRRSADGDDRTFFHSTRVGDNYVAICSTAADRGDAAAARAYTGVTGVLGRMQRHFEMEYDDDRDSRRERYALSVEALERPDGGAVVRRANVTARRQAQIEIEEQRRQLSHLARVAMLGQLSGALAHELNQPLASILSNAEAARLLLKRRPADLEELGAIVGDIVTDDQRAAEVIRRLSALLKRGETRVQPIETRELVDEVLELAHADLITRRVTATASVEPELPLVMGDRVQLQQVLLNLIINACEAMSATPVGDRRLCLTVAADAKSNVRFSTRDYGTGIPPALIDRLFEPFVTTKPEGLGLGLSISRTIVAAHGGRLWAENNADGGATLHCLLVSVPMSPVADAPRKSVGTATPPEAAPSPFSSAVVESDSLILDGAHAHSSSAPEQ